MHRVALNIASSAEQHCGKGGHAERAKYSFTWLNHCVAWGTSAASNQARTAQLQWPARTGQEKRRQQHRLLHTASRNCSIRTHIGHKHKILHQFQCEWCLLPRCPSTLVQLAGCEFHWLKARAFGAGAILHSWAPLRIGEHAHLRTCCPVVMCVQIRSA